MENYCIYVDKGSPEGDKSCYAITYGGEIIKMTTDPMRALSIKQPWAWLIANGYKDIENRSWKTKRRGWFFVHASKRIDMAGYFWVKTNFPDIPLPSLGKLQSMTGGIVGGANITDCVESSDSPWFQGKYGFTLTTPVAFNLRPCKGKLSFFQPDLF